MAAVVDLRDVFTALALLLFFALYMPLEPGPCPPCPEAEEQQQQQQQPSAATGSGSVIIYGSYDRCETVEGLGIVPRHSYSLDRGNTICPGMTTVGSIKVEGDTLFEGCPHLKLSDGTWMDLCFFVETMRSLPGEVCGTCIHGIATFPNCTCNCAPGWSGSICNVSSCGEGQGTWHPENASCTCPLPLDPATFCETVLPSEPEPSPPPSQQNSHGYYSTELQKWVCTDPGWLGPGCNSSCAVPNMSLSAQCSSRANYGLDTNLESELNWFVCGGGFTLNRDDVTAISALQCSAGENCTATFLAESAICCAPGMTCARPSCMPDDALCCALRAPDTCLHGGGCKLCDSNRCVAALITASGTCEQADLFPMIRGDWYTFYFNYSYEASIYERQRYLDLYRPCLLRPSYWNISCLTTARTAVNRASWPALAGQKAFSSSRLHAISYVNNSIAYYLTVDATSAGPLGVSAYWRPVPNATLLYLAPAEDIVSEIPHYYLVTSDKLYCLVLVDSSQVLAQAIGVYHDNGVYWRRTWSGLDECSILPLVPNIYLAADSLTGEVILDPSNALDLIIK